MRRTPIIDKIIKLSKYGFRIEWLAGIYARKGMNGLNQIENEVIRVAMRVKNE